MKPIRRCDVSDPFGPTSPPARFSNLPRGENYPRKGDFGGLLGRVLTNSRLEAPVIGEPFQPMERTSQLRLCAGTDHGSRRVYKGDATTTPACCQQSSPAELEVRARPGQRRIGAFGTTSKLQSRSSVLSERFYGLGAYRLGHCVRWCRALPGLEGDCAYHTRLHRPGDAGCRLRVYMDLGPAGLA